MISKEQRRQYNHTQYQRYIAQGVCPRCGKNPPVTNKRLCQPCIDYTTQRTAERLQKHRDAGLCMCGNPPMEGFKLCKKCQERSKLGALKANLTRSGSWAREKREQLRKQIFDHYGNKCACCEETSKWFLQIDHVYNNGSEHRKALGGRTKQIAMYKWIINHGFPSSIQLLCANCNWAKGQFGQCPHEIERYISQRKLVKECLER